MDYYDEGNLLWLNVDTTLRTQSHGKYSMNDFCRSFYGGPGGEPALKTYTFDDIVAALNALVPYGWADMLHQMLNSLSPEPPLAGVQAGGWNLAWDEHPNEIEAAREYADHELDLYSSLGMLVDSDGTVRDVVLDGLAYQAGIGPDMRIVAVNGRQFSEDVLRGAVRDSRQSTTPIEFEIANGSYVHNLKLDYHGGLRYPHLVRTQGSNMLDEILKPLASR